MLVYKEEEKSLDHTIVRKQTRTNLYLNVKSHHHQVQLQQVNKALATRSQIPAELQVRKHEVNIFKTENIRLSPRE